MTVDNGEAFDPRKLTAKRLRDKARTGLAVLTWVLTNPEMIAHTLNRESDDGLSGVAYDRQRGAPGHSDPTPLRALRGTQDPMALTAMALLGALDGLVLAGSAAQRATNIRADAAKTASQEKREAGVGDCINCGHYCAGTIILGGEKHQDRLRSGRCDPCRKYRVRNGIDRPRHLWLAATADGDMGTPDTPTNS